MKNFGKIKNTFHEILAENLLSKDKDKRLLFKNYLKLIKENKILKTQYLVYNNIENKVEENEQKAYQFIQENIEFLKQFKKKDILEANEKLFKLLENTKWKHPLADYLEGADKITKEEYEAELKKVNPTGTQGINRALKEDIQIDSKNYDFKLDNSGEHVLSMWIELPNFTGQRPNKNLFLNLLTQIKNKYKKGSIYNTFSPKFGVIYRYNYGGVGGWKALFTNDEKDTTRPQFDELTGKYAKSNAVFTLNNQTNTIPSNSLHENITTLIFTDKTPKNIDTIIESQSQIVDYIKNNKKKELTENISKDIPNSLLSKLATDKFNEKYNDLLSEDDKKIFKTVLEGTEESKKDLQENTIKECITLIDSKLNESDLEVKEKLLKAKDKLLNMKGNFISEEFTNNVSKLIELKKDLSV